MFRDVEWIEGDVFLKWIGPYLYRQKASKGDKWMLHLNGVHLGDRDRDYETIHNLQVKRRKRIKVHVAERILTRVGLDPKVDILKVTA